ncbi:hypothetical protein ACQEVY_23620 [Streptomyces sp. CA-288835]|uniref:hypothetical protein n=1 Tax=Streptomyces sp. CA-288835 TaxID=3240069 RepID=UPI003D8DF6EC
MDADSPELAELARYGLVRRGYLDPGAFMAVAPWDAESDLLAAELQCMQRSLARMGALPHVMVKATESFAAGAYHTSTRTRIIENREEVNAAIARAFEGAREEVITAQPGSRTRTAMSVASTRDAAVLQRGVAMRTLYHPSSRSSGHVQRYVKTTTGLGAQVRTLGRDFPRMVLVDSRDAFFAIQLPEAPEHGAVHTTDPVIVAWIRSIFDAFWPLGEVWDPSEPSPRTAAANTDTKRMILQLLAEGHAQKVISPRVGLSKAGLDRALAELKQDLGATSLFQLGMKWNEAQRAAESTPSEV